MYPLSYVRPDTLDQALALLADQEDAKPLSGGMTLIPTLKQRLAAPSHLVDLSRLDALRGMSLEGDVLRIGAATKHVEVSRSPLVQEAIPALAYLAGIIADPQVRNRGTLGGSVANNDPAADYPAAVLGTGAVIQTSTRRIDADDYFVGMFETALEPGELIVAIEFPIPLQAAYQKLRHRATGYAVAGVFVAVFNDQVRVAVTGAASSVFRWHEAEAVLTGDLQPGVTSDRLADIAIDDTLFSTDANGSAAYRANLVRVMTRRAVDALPARTG